jgi:hypothetical protein
MMPLFIWKRGSCQRKRGLEEKERRSVPAKYPKIVILQVIEIARVSDLNCCVCKNYPWFTDVDETTGVR